MLGLACMVRDVCAHHTEWNYSIVNSIDQVQRMDAIIGNHRSFPCADADFFADKRLGHRVGQEFSPPPCTYLALGVLEELHSRQE
jgi:hypothetical protein